MPSTPDQNRARKIRKKLEAKKTVPTGDIAWLTDYESRTVQRRKSKVQITGPDAISIQSEGNPQPSSKQPESPPGMPPATAGAVPPPLNVDPLPATAAPHGAHAAVTAHTAGAGAGAGVTPGVTSQGGGIALAAMYRQGLAAVMADIKARGGTPLPDAVIMACSLSVQALGDKYLSGAGDGLHIFNAATPVAWAWWENRKLGKKEKPAEEEVFIPQGKAPAGPSLRTVATPPKVTVPPARPSPNQVRTGPLAQSFNADRQSPSADEVAAVNAAMGSQVIA